MVRASKLDAQQWRLFADGRVHEYKVSAETMNEMMDAGLLLVYFQDLPSLASCFPESSSSCLDCYGFFGPFAPCTVPESRLPYVTLQMDMRQTVSVILWQYLLVELVLASKFFAAGL